MVTLTVLQSVVIDVKSLWCDEVQVNELLDNCYNGRLVAGENVSLRIFLAANLTRESSTSACEKIYNLQSITVVNWITLMTDLYVSAIYYF